MDRNINDTRVVVIDCPSELLENVPEVYHSKTIDVHSIKPFGPKCCCTMGSAEDFIEELSHMICKDDTGIFGIYMAHFSDENSILRFKSVLDTKYPNNLIEVINNPMYVNLEELIDSYIYILNDNPCMYHYNKDVMDKILHDWHQFCSFNSIYPTLRTLENSVIKNI